MTTKSFTNFAADLTLKTSELNLEQLRTLNEIIVGAIRNRHAIRNHEMRATLAVGARVKWTMNDGRVVTGTVYQINRKTAYVRQETAATLGYRPRWKVALNLLRLA